MEANNDTCRVKFLERAKIVGIPNYCIICAKLNSYRAVFTVYAQK